MKLLRPAIAWPLALTVAWWLSWRHLAVEWQLNAQYQSAWAVPLLCLYSAWKRWPGPCLPPAPRNPLWLALTAGAWILLALGEFLHGQDPVWRMTGALLNAGASLLTCAWFYKVGGRPLLQRGIWPVLLTWLAVPWPSPLEQALTQYLLHIVSNLTVGLVNLLGIAALLHGNVIELSNGLVGIDEACSGIRSFQAAVVASVLLGELLGLTAARRLWLFGLGVLICLLGNYLRVLALTLLMHRLGAEGYRWHDTAGICASIFEFSGIGLLALLLKKPVLIAPGNSPIPPLPPGHWKDWPGAAAFVSLPLLVALLCSWLAAQHGPLPRSALWRVTLARLPEGWTTTPLAAPAAARTLLRFSTWESYQLHSAQGWSAQLAHLYWSDGTRIPGAAFMHNPKICLASQGWVEFQKPESWTLELHGRRLACITYRLRQGNTYLAAVQILNTNTGSEFPASSFYDSSSWQHRLLSSWTAPQHQVTEEVILSLPDPGNSHDIQTLSIRLLQTLLSPNKIEHGTGSCR